jgi:hypothetical protein
MCSWFGKVPGEVEGMTTAPQIKKYWSLLAELSEGDQPLLSLEGFDGPVQYIRVTNRSLKEFFNYLEDPVWRKRNVVHSNLVCSDDVEHSNTYQILQGVNQIKEKLGI